MKPKPTEITMKAWRYLMAEKLNLTPSTIGNYLTTKRIEYPEHRRVNKRVVFVKIP